MKNISGKRQVFILIITFILSRYVAYYLDIRLDIKALYEYWQFLDLDSLKNHVLSGVWYDHAQPPLFNLFLGFILKISGSHYEIIFAFILRFITLCNALVLFFILRKLCTVYYLPLLIALIYILSPATLLFESELFYTSFVSMLLLIAVYFLIRLNESNNWKYSYGVCFPLTVLCLTRSLFHLFWLVLIVILILFSLRNNNVRSKFILISLLGILAVSSWYIKNKLLFNKFSTSTWIGMNMARNVFHDGEISDSGKIEVLAPFSRISVYRKFLDSSFEKKYQGLDDQVLLKEMKNDSFINEREVSYIPVSDLYEKASIRYIFKNPKKYLQNVIQSAILFFDPATVYSLALENASKIKYYDLVYSFNLTVFAKNKQQRRIFLIISAIPKMVVYLFVFFSFISLIRRDRNITSWNLFIWITIAYVFLASSLLEHYENMRFRYEIEPLFLILTAQLCSRLYSRYQIRKRAPLKELIT